MAQGKEERFGLRESLRMEENARRASTESPLRAKSAMTEFQEETSFLSTYLLNQVVRLGLTTETEYGRLLMKQKLDFEIFIHSFIHMH